MSAPLILGLGQSKLEELNKYTQEVMERELASFDYEKVFWNSIWSVGLIGLVWISVKFGILLDNISGVLFATGTQTKGNPVGLLSFNFYADQPAYRFQAQFFTTVDYVEGVKKNDPVPHPDTPAGMMYAAIERYRENPEEYEAFKKKMFDEWLANYPDTKARPSLETQYQEYIKTDITADEAKEETDHYRNITGRTILDYADNFFNTYGAVLPFGAVVLHYGLEYERVERVKKKVGKGKVKK